MKVPVEDYDDELHADPIKLIFDENHNSACSFNNATVKDVINTPSELKIETIDLTCPSNSGVIKMPKPLQPSGACYKVKQLAVQLVDLKKFPWYYKKYFKHYEDNDITKGIIVGDIENITSDMYMKIKYDTNKGQWQIHEGNTNNLPRRNNTAITQTALPGNFNKIDFKRNKGLVGMTITQIVKEERICPSLFETENEGKDLIDTPVDNEEPSKRKTDLIQKGGADSEVIKTIAPSNVVTFLVDSKVKEIIEDKRKDLKIMSEKNDQRVIKSQPAKLLDAESNKPNSNVKAAPQKDKLVTPTKRKCLTPAVIRIQKKYIRKEQKPACFVCEVQPGEHTSDKNTKRSKNITNLCVEKILPAPVSDANPRDVSSLPLISERKVAVIENTSKQFQDIKKFVEKATKLAPTKTLKRTEKEASKYNKLKALDMPLLTEENYDQSGAASHRRMSLKDSIVFENDLNSNDYIGGKKSEGNNITLTTVHQNIEHNNLVSLQQSPNLISGNVTTTFAPTSTHTTPIASHVTPSGFRPRMKYTPVNRDYATPTNHNVASTNYSDYVRHSQSLLKCPSTVSSIGHNVQNRNIVQLLKAPLMSANTAGTIQHQLPVQQISQYGAPPSYESHYQVAPGYATPLRNSNLTNDYRMYGNNGSEVNPHYYYHTYSGYVAPPQFSAPPPLPPPQAPQWQTNMSYNQNPVSSHHLNSSIIGWNNRNVEQTNNTASSATCNPKLSNKGDKRLISVDAIRAQLSNPVDIKKLNKIRAPRTLMTTDEVINNKKKLLQNLNDFVVIGSSPTDKTLKRPYTKRLSEVKRTQNSELNKNLEVLSKRSRTVPLPVSSQVKVSTYSPPILPIPTYENMLSKIYNVKKPTNGAEVNGAGDTKCSKRNMLTEALDNSKKISVEEYKKRFTKSDSADLNSLVGRSVVDTKDTAGLVPNYTTKKMKGRNYSLDQDLGYSSDTNVKM